MGFVQEDLEEAVGKKWAKRIGLIVLVLLFLTSTTMFFHIWPFSSAAGVVKTVTSSESIISNYQWYYDQFNAIKAQQANIQAMPVGAPELPGMKMVLNNSIAEYNSRSKQITRNLWKASDLPYQIDLQGASK